MPNIYSRFLHNSLYRNSIYLMLSTVVMAFFGFFFWIIAARLYSTEQIGLATTLVSIMGLITNFSLLGLNNTLIRYLPKSQQKNEKINTAFTLVILTTFVVSLSFVLGIHILSPKLLFIRQNFFYSLLFILFMIFYTLQTLTESIFIAYRTTNYILAKNTILSVAKLILPFFLVTLSAMGIFMSFGFASIISFILAFVILIKRFQYSYAIVINIDLVKKLAKFSFANYITTFLTGLPTLILPIIITNNINPKTSAYFYIDIMIANMLYIIPLATAQSLFAEGSHNEKGIRSHLKKSLQIIGTLLIPAIIITVLFGKYILAVFGKGYASDGFFFLQLLAISGIFIAINYLGSVLLNIEHRIGLLVMFNILTASSILLFSLIFLRFGLVGIGYAWILGQAISSLLYGYEIKRYFI